MIFVSYSRSDIADARALVESLSASDVECWLDESNIPVGQAFVERLGNALLGADGFLLLDTPASRSSYWVSRELLTSSRYRRSGRYQTALRLYSSDCEHTNATNWDASLPLDQQAHEHVAKFLSVRRTTRDVPDPEVEFRDVSIKCEAGLGQPSNWTGRQDDLRSLDQWWFGSTAGVWLCGLGGAGKSGLLQTWVTALCCLGYDQAVSANVLYLGGKELVDVSDTRQTVSAWSSQTASPCKVLLLDGHDEVPSMANVDEILWEAIRSGIRVLVTSRDALPPSFGDYFTNLTLSSMTRRDSVAILSQFGVNRPEGERIAEELGNHPLALLIFSRSLASKNQTPSEALIELHHIREGGSTGDVGLSRMIRAVFSRSVRSLTADAMSLLNILCQNAEGGVGPLELARPSIRELATAGLVQVDHLDNPTQVSIHPMVRRFIDEECQGKGKRLVLES